MLPSMMERKIRSGIVMVSSTGAECPFPVVATYCASKSYASFLAQGVGMEIEDKIDLMSFEPAEVHTNIIAEKPNMKVISADRAAETCFRDIGYDTSSTGAFRHELRRLHIWLVGSAAGKSTLEAVKKAN
jgi:short-subunit dehydrogenase